MMSYIVQAREVKDKIRRSVGGKSAACAVHGVLAAACNIGPKYVHYDSRAIEFEVTLSNGGQRRFTRSADGWFADAGKAAVELTSSDARSLIVLCGALLTIAWRAKHSVEVISLSTDAPAWNPRSVVGPRSVVKVDGCVYDHDPLPLLVDDYFGWLWDEPAKATEAEVERLGLELARLAARA